MIRLLTAMLVLSSPVSTGGAATSSGLSSGEAGASSPLPSGGGQGEGNGDRDPVGSSSKPVPSAVQASPATILIRAKRPPEGIPASASSESIDLAAWRVRALVTGDLLERLPGVDVQSFGSGQGSFVRIRGSSSSEVLVLVDGVRMNPVAGGGADLELLPLELFDRIDVARGAGAARYGADALGGVVELRSDPSGRREGATLAASSAGTVRVSAGALARQGAWALDASARDEELADHWRYRDSLRGRMMERANAGGRLAGGSLGARGPLGSGELSARIWGASLSGGSPGLSEFPTPEARHDGSRGTLSLRWEDAERGLAVDASERVESERYDDPDPPLGTAAIHSASRGDATAASVVRRAAAGGAVVAVGADARAERLAGSGGLQARAAGGVHGTLTGGAGGLQADLGARLDGVSGADGVAWTPIPSAGVRWTLPGGVSLRAHGGRAWRIPSMTELWMPPENGMRGNPSLEPEDAWSGDAGAGWERHGALSFRAEGSLFATRLREGIVWAPVGPFTYGPVNTGPATIEGGELGATLGLVDHASLQASWTHTLTRLDQTGAPLPGRAKDRLFARAAGSAGPLEPFVEVTRTSATYVDFFGNLTVPASTAVGAGATFTLARGPLSGAAATLEGTNLTNADLRDSRYFPEPGRTLWLTLSWRTPAPSSGAKE